MLSATGCLTAGDGIFYAGTIAIRALPLGAIMIIPQVLLLIKIAFNRFLRIILPPKSKALARLPPMPKKRALDARAHDNEGADDDDEKKSEFYDGESFVRHCKSSGCAGQLTNFME